MSENSEPPVNWSEAEVAELEALEARNNALPLDAPRALLSIRLSVLTEHTTSPVRQELDLRRHAADSMLRVVGVARDLNVSATKIPPWKRKELGHWLNDRIPEFDVLLFWKLDRFVRRILDLQVMIEWCQKFDKGLQSLNDPIDLRSQRGKNVVALIAGMAEIEAANTGTRVASLWQYNKTQEKWLIGKPPYGYRTKRIDKEVKVVIDPSQQKVIRWMASAVIRGRTVGKCTTILNRAGAPSPAGKKWDATGVKRVLRNPAIKGLRVESIKKPGKSRESRPLLDSNGHPIRVADPIIGDDVFDAVQEALDSRRRRFTPKTQGSTKFLGVIICANERTGGECGNNLRVYNVKNRPNGKQYTYLRCDKCTGAAFPPDQVYSALKNAVIDHLGDYPVEYREYARGAEIRAEMKRLEGAIRYYMDSLEPGGRFAKAGFVRDKAEKTLDSLAKEMEKIDPESTKDRWILSRDGKTYREIWESGTPEDIAVDLRRADIKFALRKIDGEIDSELRIPADVEERLPIREDEFKSKF
ncbi:MULTISPECIES: recombinase family protein [unclassified Streptomyces]|uniref:recombinase family protein n=1 Tax=unclassified Streptomyces TaxID=2593676 RepID=UPI002E19692F|nr:MULTISPECIES: recombinase family protein [unclassified Streptomyces]